MMAGSEHGAEHLINRSSPVLREHDGASDVEVLEANEAENRISSEVLLTAVGRDKPKRKKLSKRSSISREIQQADTVMTGKELDELIEAGSQVLENLDVVAILRQTIRKPQAVPRVVVTEVSNRRKAKSDPGRRSPDGSGHVLDSAGIDDQVRLSEIALEEQESKLGAAGQRLRSALQALANVKLADKPIAKPKRYRKAKKAKEKKSNAGHLPPLLIDYYNAAAQVRFLTEELVDLDYAHEEDIAGRQLRVDQDESLSVTDSIFEQQYREQRAGVEESLDTAIVEADHLKARCLEEEIDIRAGLSRQHESDLDSEEALQMDVRYSDSEPAPLPQQIKMRSGRPLPRSKAQLSTGFLDALTEAETEKASAQEKSPFNISEWIQDIEPINTSPECDNSPEPSYRLASSYLSSPGSDQDTEEKDASTEAYTALVDAPHFESTCSRGYFPRGQHNI